MEPTNYGGFQYGTAKDTKKKDKDTENLETTAYWLRNLAITYGVLSIGCMVCGVMTLVYAFTDIHWPFSSGSGIWAGFLAFLTSVFGIQGFKGYDVHNPSRNKCMIITFYTFVVMMITMGILHLVYSAICYAYCAQDYVKDGVHQCFIGNKSKIMLAEGFNVAFGSMLCILSIVTTVYMSIGRRIRKLTGMPMNQDLVVYGTCCGGSCKCYGNL